MRCPDCQKRIPNKSLYCNLCGNKIANHTTHSTIPENFVFDKASGWYHTIELKRDKKAKLIEEITYYNPEEDWFLTELLRDHPSYKKENGEESDGPIGEASEYLYDEIQEMYYLSAVSVDSKTKEIIQQVSYFYPKDKTFININYLILKNRPSLPNTKKKQHLSDVLKKIITTTKGRKPSQIKQRTESTPLEIEAMHDSAPDSSDDETSLEKPRQENAQASKRTLALRAITLFFSFLTVVFLLYHALLWADVLPNNFLTTTVREFQLGEAMSGGVSELDEWPVFPYISTVYKHAVLDNRYLYYKSANRQSEVIYRYSFAENLLETLVESPNSKTSIVSFAVTQRFCYYGFAEKNSAEARYYRLDLQSGKFHFLLESDTSALFAANNKVYLLSPSGQYLRVFSEVTTNPDAYEHFAVPVKQGAFLVANNFSVHKGILYYEQLSGGKQQFFAYHLDTLVQEQLLPTLGELSTENLSIEENSYFYQQGNNFVRQTLQEVQTLLLIENTANSKEKFAVKLGDSLVYTTPAGTFISPLTDLSEKTMLSEYAPLAIAKGYLVFPNAIYSLQERKEILLKELAIQSPTYSTQDAAVEK